MRIRQRIGRLTRQGKYHHVASDLYLPFRPYRNRHARIPLDLTYLFLTPPSSGVTTHLIPSHSTQTPFSDACTPLNGSRETMIMLDLIIALKVHDDVWADESELHLGQPEAFLDLFDLMQLRGSPLCLPCTVASRPDRKQLHVRSEARRGRRPLSSDDRRCRTR